MTSVDEDVEPSYTNGRLVIWYNHLGNSLAGSQMTIELSYDPAN